MATEVILPAAAKPWFDTGIDVTQGQTVRITVPPGQTWIDWFLTYGPEGGTHWTQAPFRPLLRVKVDSRGQRAEFFTLVTGVVMSGAPNKLAQTIVVGAGPVIFSTQHPGRLVCFANDVPGASWNNKGEMHLVIT